MKQVPLVLAVMSSERAIDYEEIVRRVIQLMPKPPRVKAAVLDFGKESETPFTPAGLVSSYIDVPSTDHKQCCVMRKTTLDSRGLTSTTKTPTHSSAHPLHCHSGPQTHGPHVPTAAEKGQHSRR
ncbi:Hypp8288 [Branchiostoma lanceolatum]|uniref:Hypp8288 protein n=1 Tax=Branchiostoma lanceolatum TaxID=7740 RepID=A0A8K0EEF7_BRALA|nr:Hypp8288 [Branchiostoma lanceolatum]